MDINNQDLQFANYEVSVKLKELGFDEASPAFYTEEGRGLAYQMCSGLNGATNLFVGNHYTVAPLIQQVRMFLMLEYHVNLSVDLITGVDNILPYFEINYRGGGMNRVGILFYDAKSNNIREEYYEAINKSFEVILEDIEQDKIKKV